MSNIIENWEFKQQKKVGPYWYKTTVYFCVLCGRQNKYRERQYDPKPENPSDRTSWHQDACNEHFM